MYTVSNYNTRNRENYTLLKRLEIFQKSFVPDIVNHQNNTNSVIYQKQHIKTVGMLNLHLTLGNRR